MILLLLLGVVIALLLYTINVLIYKLPALTSRSSSLSQLIQTYECGFEALTNQSRFRHTIAYYIVALLYVIFDLEVALILPGIIGFVYIGSVGTILLLLVMTLLCFCFIYELNIGVFNSIINTKDLAASKVNNVNIV